MFQNLPSRRTKHNLISFLSVQSLSLSISNLNCSWISDYIFIFSFNLSPTVLHLGVWGGSMGFFGDHMYGFLYTALVTRHSELTVRENISVLPLLICCTVLVVMEHLMKLPHNGAALELPEQISFSVMSLLFLLVIFHKLSLLKWHRKPVFIHLDTQAWGRHVWTCWTSCCSRRVMETKDCWRQLDHIGLFIDWLSSVLKLVALPAPALLCLDSCSCICPNPSLLCFCFPFYTCGFEVDYLQPSLWAIVCQHSLGFCNK